MEQTETEVIESDDLQDDRRIHEIQLRIQNNCDDIESAITEYRLIGFDYEARNLRAALRNAEEPVGELTEAQVTNLEWCVELVGLLG